MLGARARAAEYNAAKAATARQQATRELEEPRLPPKPAPVSLSAFTRNASYSRNRGAKNFVPLILSEEEEKKSTSSIELASERDRSESPQADLFLRPASLPPPQTKISNTVEMEHTARTPMRYTSPRSQMQQYTTTPRSMHKEDGYGFSMASMAFPTQHLIPYQQIRPYVSQPHVIPGPHIGWYTPTSFYGTHCSYPDAGVVPIASFTEPRSRPDHSLSRESTVLSDPVTQSPPKPSPERKRPATPAVTLGGPTLHVFGPDDLSPFKMEIKQQAREKYFAKHPAQQSTPTTTRASENVSMLRSPEASLMGSLTRSAQVPLHCLVKGSRLRSADVKDASIVYDGFVPVSMQRSSASTGLFSRPSYPSKIEQLELCGPTDDIWSSKDTENLHRQTVASDGSPIRYSRSTRYNTSDEDLGKTVTNSTPPDVGSGFVERHVSFQASDSVHTPPPPTPSQDLDRMRREQEQRFVIERLLTYPDNPEWWEVHGSSAEDRERIVMLRRAMSSSFDTISENRGVSVIKQEEVRIQYQQSRGDFERRRKCVRDLADELKHKWEYGGQFRGPAMTKEEAKKHAGTVEEIGHMMTMLSVLADGNHCGLGSRPYVQPPEYAIERRICTDREVCTSLFEQEGDEVRAAPPRLARDPRFRAQLNEGMKIRGDEERIPRMFTSRSRMQN